MMNPFRMFDVIERRMNRIFQDEYGGFGRSYHDPFDDFQSRIDGFRPGDPMQDFFT